MHALPIDADVTGGTGADVANGIVHSVKKLGIKEPTKAAGATTDRGGGEKKADGTLISKGIMREDPLKTYCHLHGLNLEVSVPILKILMRPDVSGQDSRSAPQLIFACYAWEKAAGKSATTMYWEETVSYCIAGEHNIDDNCEEVTELMDQIQVMASGAEDGEMKFRAMLKGCVTRWSTVGEAATLLYDTLEIRIVMAKKFDDRNKKGKAQETCRDFLSRASEPEIICDLALLKSQHQFYVKPQMTWAMKPDYHTRKAAFQSFNMFVRKFLQQEDYDRMQNWSGIPEFQDLVREVNKLPEAERATQVHKINKYLEIAEEEHKNFVLEWAKIEGNAFLACFAEIETGRLVSQRILGYSYCADKAKTEYDLSRGLWIDSSSNGTSIIRMSGCVVETMLYSPSFGMRSGSNK